MKLRLPEDPEPLLLTVRQSVIALVCAFGLGALLTLWGFIFYLRYLQPGIHS